MKYKVTNNVEMLNEEFNLEEYNMTNDDYVNDYIDAESEEEAIRTAMDYLSEQIQNNGFDVDVNKEEKEMTVYKDDEPLEKWNNFRAEEQVRSISSLQASSNSGVPLSIKYCLQPVSRCSKKSFTTLS